MSFHNLEEYLTTYRPVASYDPSVLLFEQAITLNDVYRHLGTLIKSTLNIMDVDLNSNVYYIPINNQNFTSVVEVAYTAKPYPQFNLKIINTNDNTQPCLHIRIYIEQTLLAKIVFVRSLNVKCIIPD